jgi:hypothetical protein
MADVDGKGLEGRHGVVTEELVATAPFVPIPLTDEDLIRPFVDERAIPIQQVMPDFTKDVHGEL